LVKCVADFHPRLIGLTGTPEQIRQVARAYRVYHSSNQTNEADSDYLVDHSIFYYLVDENNRFVQYYGQTVKPTDAFKSIREHMRMGMKVSYGKMVWNRIYDFFFDKIHRI
jgi:protein SCO1/2